MRSRWREILEWLMLQLFLVRPFRCQECGLRYLGFLFSKRQTAQQPFL
jgi:hypothetical protein